VRTVESTLYLPGPATNFEKGISELVVRYLDTRGFILTSRIELASWNANQRVPFQSRYNLTIYPAGTYIVGRR